MSKYRICLWGGYYRRLLVPLSCKLWPVGSKGSLMLTMYLEQPLYCRAENEHFPVSSKPVLIALNYRARNPYLPIDLFSVYYKLTQYLLMTLAKMYPTLTSRLCCRRDRTHKPLGNGFKLFKPIILLCKRSQVVMRWVKVSVWSAPFQNSTCLNFHPMYVFLVEHNKTINLLFLYTWYTYSYL